MRAVGETIQVLLWVFIALLWVRFVIEWVQVFARSWTPKGPALVLLEGVFTVTDPPIKGLRAILPRPKIGGFVLDLSLLIVLVLAYVLLRLNHSLLIA